MIDDHPMVESSQESRDIEEAINAIAQSYESDFAINNLESAALPNKRAVIHAFENIAPLVYLGFYSTRPLNRSNLRYAISECVYPAYELLCEQIHRAVTYESSQGRMAAPADAAFAHQAATQLFSSLPRLREMLNEDALAAFHNDPAAHSVEEVVFSYPTLVAITAYRVAHVLYTNGVPMIPRILSEYAHSRTGIDINPGATIGRRLFIDHGTGIVVGETAVIGDDVKLYQGVTLGALSTRRALEEERTARPKRHPTIKDRVTIYSGATILGGDTIVGEDSTIGGNVWLVRSVPPGSKIFGRPRGTETDDHAR
ncbi:MAG: serine O-acetyltransferase [Polyangiaceae bacterium]|nr:serine O-acetyltransferase [Polyangiaceae bacterium]